VEVALLSQKKQLWIQIGDGLTKLVATKTAILEILGMPVHAQIQFLVLKIVHLME
jgi:hypothetical protein